MTLHSHKTQIRTVYLLIISLAYTFAYSATVDASCNRLLKTVNASDSEWIRVCVRDPEKPLLDPSYPKRLYDSLTDVFVPWFENHKLHGKDGFIKMLTSQHRILSVGTSKNEIYQGASRRELGIPTGYIVQPAILRHQWAPGGPGFSFALRFDQHLPNDMTVQIRENVLTFLQNRPIDAPSEPIERTVDTMPLSSSSIQLFKLPRLKKKVRTWATYFEHYVAPHYPTSDEVPLILGAMGNILGDVKSLSRKVHSRQNTNQLVRLLAEYIYLGSHAHMFTGGNYSLVMGQVNFLLGEWGLRGISHTNLDYLAMAAPIEILEWRFRRDIKDSNPLDDRIESNQVPPSPSDNWEDKTILLHISSRGDKAFWASDRMGEPNERIEGVVFPKFHTEKIKLLAKAHLAGTGDTPWIEGGKFLGTRGESRAMLGLRLKLEGENANQYNIRYRTRRNKAGKSAIVQNGAYSGTKNNSDFLSGIEVWLESKE